jgi:hypothetical protein
MKRGKILVETGKPLQFIVEEDDSEPSIEIGINSQTEIRQIGDTIAAYIGAGNQLLKNRYVQLAMIAPRHLRDHCSIFVLRCADGILVRYDPSKDDKKTLRIAENASTLAELVPGFSERAVYLDAIPQNLQQSDCLSLNLATIDPGGVKHTERTIPLVGLANSKLPQDFVQAPPPARPTPIMSIVNEIELELGGTIEDVNPVHGAMAKNQQFVARSKVQLPVGWLAIEIYPILGMEHWQPSFAPLWAELDILASAAKWNLQQARLNTLDSRVDVREAYVALLDEFESLLKGPEEPVHQFLKANPELISPTSNQCWSKLAFGDRKSDFVFREANDDYELVELEAPVRLLFRKDEQPRVELTHAINQISDWIRYIEDNKQKVELELGLIGISANPRTLIVIGRSDTLSKNNRRKLVTLQSQIPKMRILTYDDLLINARATLERILGPLNFRTQNLRLYFYPSDSKSR